MHAINPLAARDVTPGHSWAFRDHRTMREVCPPTEFVEARLFEVTAILRSPSSPPSLRALAARVQRRWGRR